MSNLFYVIMPVVNAIYYFPEWSTCGASSYWQINCMVHQHSFLFLCFCSKHLLELSEVLSIMPLVWYATSWNMFELAQRHPFSGETVFTFRRTTGFRNLKGFFSLHHTQGPMKGSERLKGDFTFLIEGCKGYYTVDLIAFKYTLCKYNLFCGLSEKGKNWYKHFTLSQDKYKRKGFKGASR